MAQVIVKQRDVMLRHVSQCSSLAKLKRRVGTFNQKSKPIEIKQVWISPIGELKASAVGGGQCMPTPRQILTTPQVVTPQKKKIVQLPLFAPRSVTLVLAKLPVPQAFEDFTLAPRMLKNSVLLVPQILQAFELTYNLLMLLSKRSLRQQSKAQLGRRHSIFQMLGLIHTHLCSSQIQLIE